MFAALETARTDLILHCGDWTDVALLDELSRIAPTDGVAGNNDSAALHERLGTHKVIVVAGARLGITHGHLAPGRTTPERALNAFARQPDLTAILFGHSHIPLLRRLDDGRWLINPGSATDRRRQPERTFALLAIEAGNITAADVRSIGGVSACRGTRSRARSGGCRRPA